MIYINLIFVFLVLVAIHEYGHYIVARLFKAEVTDFSIGFGKPLLKYKDRNGTTWKLSPIPLGGYVKIKGLDNIFSPNPNDEQGSFQSLTLFQKILVLLAGSIFNILSAWFALFCIFFFFGIVSLMPIIGSVSENSSAFENDLREGDKIIVRLASQGSFKSGSAQLQQGFLQLLDEVGGAIQDVQGLITIEGHTDNLPVGFSLRFRSNWDLSAARSGAVADYMLTKYSFDNGLMVSGLADTKPLMSNDTSEGRNRNRRIEVVIDGSF